MTRQARRHPRSVGWRGFSVTEYILAITITAILAAFIMPIVLNGAERSRMSRARADVAGLAKAVAKMRADTGMTAQSCLTNLSNLQSNTLMAACTNSNFTLYTMTTCSQALTGQACWGGPYINNVSVDPWGNPYKVSFDTSSWAVIVASTGPDGSAGTTDDLSYVQ